LLDVQSALIAAAMPAAQGQVASQLQAQYLLVFGWKGKFSRWEWSNGFCFVITNVPGAVAAAAWVSRASKVDCTGSISGRNPDTSVGVMLVPGPWAFGFGRVVGIVAGSTSVSDAKKKQTANDSVDYSSEHGDKARRNR
jgi:hypothetical protein